MVPGMSALSLLAAAVALSGGVAEPPVRLDAPVARSGAPLQIRLSSPYDAGQALKAQGIARTSVDRRLQGEASSAAIGFLCGMQPSTQTHGGAGALGVDTEGRFLGAQLKFGFR